MLLWISIKDFVGTNCELIESSIDCYVMTRLEKELTQIEAKRRRQVVKRRQQWRDHGS